MKYRLEIRPLATIEIIEAYDWYETQREGLGLEFLTELDTFYTTLTVNPHIYSFYTRPVREGKINRFPYTVLYEVVNEVIVVYTVFMAKQDPAKKRTM